ncbi:hypothetical protein BC833DRAFT_569788 [Globomyces pollinis-pini]|nr:hypothetical protein BC833DRAFT_569788 [Globomyces pollinis-pini]
MYEVLVTDHFKVAIVCEFDDWKSTYPLEKVDLNLFRGSIEAENPLVFQFVVDGTLTLSDQFKIIKNENGTEYHVLDINETNAPVESHHELELNNNLDLTPHPKNNILENSINVNTPISQSHNVKNLVQSFNQLVENKNEKTVDTRTVSSN